MEKPPYQITIRRLCSLFGIAVFQKVFHFIKCQVFHAEVFHRSAVCPVIGLHQSAAQIGNGIHQRCFQSQCPRKGGKADHGIRSILAQIPVIPNCSLPPRHSAILSAKCSRYLKQVRNKKAPHMGCFLQLSVSLFLFARSETIVLYIVSSIRNFL